MAGDVAVASTWEGTQEYPIGASGFANLVPTFSSAMHARVASGTMFRVTFSSTCIGILTQFEPLYLNPTIRSTGQPANVGKFAPVMTTNSPARGALLYG